jgi:hypothetical protein
VSDAARRAHYSTPLYRMSDAEWARHEAAHLAGVALRGLGRGDSPDFKLYDGEEALNVMAALPLGTHRRCRFSWWTWGLPAGAWPHWALEVYTEMEERGLEVGP